MFYAAAYWQDLAMNNVFMNRLGKRGSGVKIYDDDNFKEEDIKTSCFLV